MISNDPKKILLVQLFSNGDCLFATAVARQVKTDFPNCNLTWAIAAFCKNIIALNPYVDMFIIMGYDYYYSGSGTAGPEAPLYNFETSYNYTLTKSVTYYLKQGVTPAKLLLGLPYYGREWQTVSSLAPAATSGTFTTTRLYNYVKNNPSTYKKFTAPT